MKLNIKKLLSLSLASVSLAFTPVSAVLPDCKSLEDFKDPAFCEKFAEEFYEKNLTTDTEACQKTVIEMTKEEKEEFISLIRSLEGYLAKRLVLYIINRKISHGKDPISAKEAIKKFWLEILENAELKGICEKEGFDTVLKNFCHVKIKDFGDEKSGHTSIFLTFHSEPYEECMSSNGVMIINSGTFFSIRYKN